MDKPTSLTTMLPRLMVGLWLTAVLAGPVTAQEEVAPATDGAFVPEVPTSYSGAGSFFNRQLGTALRFSYHSEGYGTTEGVVSLGSMKVWADEGSTIFFDAQGTMSDEFGGGFNAGLGYRTLNNIGFGPDPLRIHGVSFWTDGQSTVNDNFFTQLGVGLESLGDSIDLRFQGYFPLDRFKDSDEVSNVEVDPFYSSNFLIGDFDQFARDTALTVLDLEGAKRVFNLEAWAFLGGYHLTGSEFDATGYRAGVRGYAVPDLALSVQVTDDDIYHTNVMFGITWFVGRTHRLNAPCGTLLDRFREPVLRNDFIATTQTLISIPGDPLTDPNTGDPIFIVHVNSNAPAGGDGTFENPFQTLEDAEAGSAEDNIVLAHAESVFDPTDTITLQDGQRWLGEGVDPNDPNSVPIVHTVDTAERGIIDLPETSPGSSLLDRPLVNGMGTVFEMADNSELNNFDIDGGVTAVVANAVSSPRLGNLRIESPTGDAIVFTDVTGSSLIENTVFVNTPGGRGIVIDGGAGVIGANAMVTNSTGYLIEIFDRGGGSVTVGQLLQESMGQGVLVHDNTGGNITFSSLADITTDGADSAVELENNTGTTIAFQQLQASSGDADTFVVTGGGTISVANPTVDDPNDEALIENTGTGSALVVVGDGDPNAADPNAIVGNPSVTVLADVVNEGTGRVVDIHDMGGGSVSVSGDVTDNGGTGMGIRVRDNSAGTYSFAGVNTLSTGANTAVELRNNTGATITLSNLNATAAAGDTFVVVGGGTVTVNDPNDSPGIQNTGTGAALVVLGDNDPNPDPNFAGVGNPTVTIATNITNTGGDQAVDIQHMSGGGVTINGDVTDDQLSGMGVLVANNTMGTYAFNGNTTLNTGANRAVTLQDNTGATVTFDRLNANASAGDTFFVEGGGTISVTDPNSTITNDGAGSALVVSGNAGSGTGNPTVTIAADVRNSGGGRVVDIQDMTAGGVTVSGDVTDPNSLGILVQDNSAGTYAFTGNTTITTTGANQAVTLQNNTGATINFTNLDATAEDATTFSVVGGGTVNVSDPNNSGTGITNTGTGSALVVRGDADLTGVGNPTVTVAKDIANGGGGHAVDIQDMTVGSVNITGDVSDPNDDGSGILVQDNTAGTATFTGVVTLSTGTNDAVTVTGNSSGHTTTFSNASRLDIDTTTGRGIVHSGASALSVLGTGNTIDTTMAGGVAMAFTSAGNANINNVTVNAAADNAVEIEHSAAGNSIVALTNVNITDAGGIGADILFDSTGQLDVRMNNVDMSGIDGDGIVINTGANANRLDFTLQNSSITVADNNALDANLDESNTAEVRFLIDPNNQLFNASAGNATVDITVDSSMLLSATIGNGPAGLDPNAPTPPIGNRNRFVNTAGGGDAVVITANNGARINLDLRDNTAQADDLQFQLTQNGASTFNLVDMTDTVNDENNIGDVTTTGTIGNIAAPVLQPD